MLRTTPREVTGLRRVGSMRPTWVPAEPLTYLIGTLVAHTMLIQGFVPYRTVSEEEGPEERGNDSKTLMCFRSKSWLQCCKGRIRGSRMNYLKQDGTSSIHVHISILRSRLDRGHGFRFPTSRSIDNVSSSSLSSRISTSQINYRPVKNLPSCEP